MSQLATETTARAGTVGADVMRVHELVGTNDLRPKCGAGKDEPVDEWLRAVNCPDCQTR
ncbi:hypothetical protein [Streptomyces benahoarensis]|uniref:hypothetical protein n=1 Tax=Streptomyces benahoarensis TaxID=2595054 RepID=UPI00163DB534|nr:hypothetical protein [Streptomyces benahoarensis]